MPEILIRTDKPRFSDFGDDADAWRQARARYAAYNELRWTYAFLAFLTGILAGGLSLLY